MSTQHTGQGLRGVSPITIEVSDSREGSTSESVTIASPTNASPTRSHKSEFLRAAISENENDNGDAELEPARRFKSLAEVYEDLQTSEFQDEAAVSDASDIEGDEIHSVAAWVESTTPVSRSKNERILKSTHPEAVKTPSPTKTPFMQDALPTIADDEEESQQVTYKFKLTELKAVKEAVSEWKVGQRLDGKKIDQGRTRLLSTAAVSESGTVAARLTNEEALDYCQAVGYYRIYHDDPDLMDDDGESDIAKALLQALRTRQRYLTRSCQLKKSDSFLHAAHSKRARHESVSVSDSMHEAQTRPASRAPSLSVKAMQPRVGACYSANCRSGSIDRPCFAPGCPRTSHWFEPKNGVFEVHDHKQRKQGLFPYIELTTWHRDTSALLSLIVDGATKSFAYNRMEYLRKRFQMHRMLNETDETAAQKTAPHRDFYNVRKVDTHVHLSACMNQKHLLRFIKKKMKTEQNVEVLCRDGKVQTLSEVFESVGLTAYDMNVDLLDVHADRSLFHRFDRFNKKYNPIGSSALREIFLKTDNYIKGRYYAELIKEVMTDLEDSKYQMAEYRISCYGKHPQEWAKLADWFDRWDVRSPNVMWLIQTPRIYNVYAKAGLLKNFGEMLDNLFRPLFEATANPEAHPQLAKLLEQVVGFDSVDDESKPEPANKTKFPAPQDWTATANPSYSTYIYYFHANMSVLNQFRRSKGMNTFVLRPHCGEAGPVDHLVAGFLAAEGINHGIMLRKAPVLKFLYYLAGIGIAMSPLSNNSLFIDIHSNPFYDYFETGMFVSLSTDDPLQFHMSREPLIEEYAIARQVWKLSSADLCELCANSVLMSGFTDAEKRKWLGPNYALPGPLGNDVKMSNVPDARSSFRFETLMREIYILDELTRGRATSTV